MLNAVLNNLINIGWAMLIFLCAYLSNVAFSLYYNIKILLQPFDKQKMINSGLKVATFVVGLTLLLSLIHISVKCSNRRQTAFQVKDDRCKRSCASLGVNP